MLQRPAFDLPALRLAFGTVGLSLADSERCIAIASTALCLREITKPLADTGGASHRVERCAALHTRRDL